MTFACVLRSGGDFRPEWVHALRRGLNIWAPPGYRFVCLSDVPLGVWSRPLTHDWPGWWSKANLFGPGVFERGERIVYLDLDTLPTGDLSDIASYSGPLACLNDFYQGRTMIGSGVMAWTPSERTEAIYHAFVGQQDRLHTLRGRSDYFYRPFFEDADRLQELYPGQLVTLKPIDGSRDPKVHGPPEGARLVAAHGRPRFTDPKAGWAHRVWLERVNGVRRAA